MSGNRICPVCSTLSVGCSSTMLARTDKSPSDGEVIFRKFSEVIFGMNGASGFKKSLEMVRLFRVVFFFGKCISALVTQLMLNRVNSCSDDC